MVEAQLSDGRRMGVRAGRKILRGETIETAPVIPIPPDHTQIVLQTDLVPYLVPWSPQGVAALPLGFAAMYREADAPNARWRKDVGEMVMEITAARDIDRGEEITVPPREPVLR